MGELHVAPRPCNTCPYVRATPPGIWHPDEYAKLAAYDEHPGPLAAFHCHQENHTGVATACRGWLMVHGDSLAVRLAGSCGRLAPEHVGMAPDASVYATGTEAMAAGLAGVHDPDARARAAIEKLIAKGGVTA